MQKRMDEARVAYATETMDVAMDKLTVEKDIAQTVKVRPICAPLLFRGSAATCRG